jgi:hypothetical protein
MGEDYHSFFYGTQQQDPPSPQSEAFEWVVNDDLQQVPVLSVNGNGTGADDDGGGRLAQRYSLAVLYFSTKMSWSPSSSSLSSQADSGKKILILPGCPTRMNVCVRQWIRKRVANASTTRW